jgi:hypothetical protein
VAIAWYFFYGIHHSTLRRAEARVGETVAEPAP